MVKRLFDICFAATGLLFAAPVICVAGVAIRLTSPGPVFYQARRIGRFGHEFKMLKLRSMHVASDSKSAITSCGDTRVFLIGRVLRAAKIDELPQLWNVLIGQMSVVGPRPEDPKIVADHFSAADRTTLDVRPGLTSPGSIYNYTHGERLIDGVDPEQSYIERLLPIKMALERVYIQRLSLKYDLQLVVRTAWILIRKMMGHAEFANPPELQPALQDLGRTRKDTYADECPMAVSAASQTGFTFAVQSTRLHHGGTS